MKENQILVRKFYVKFKINNNNPKSFGMALGQANNMLKKYTFDEIDKAIDLLFLKQPKDGVYSFMFLKYVLDELVTEIRARENKIVDYKPLEVKEELKKEEVKIKNNFAKKGLVNF